LLSDAVPRVFSSATLGVSLAALRALANSAALFLHEVFRREWPRRNSGAEPMAPSEADAANTASFDTDGVHSVLSPMVSNLSPILAATKLLHHDAAAKRHSVGGRKERKLTALLSAVNGYAVCCSSLSVQQYRSHCHRAFVRDCWGYFMSPRFFVFCSISTLHHWQWVLGAIIECDGSNKLRGELLSSPSSMSIHSLLASHEVEIENRRAQLKRLAVVIHSGRRDQYGRYLTAIIGKLVESLKVPRAARLYSQVFVALRVLLTRINVANLSPIWPLIITETIRAFERSSDKELLLSVCKFVDTALILLPQTFQLFKWSFIADHDAAAAVQPEDRHSVFVPHLQTLAARLEHEVQRKRARQRAAEREAKVDDDDDDGGDDGKEPLQRRERERSDTHSMAGGFGSGVSSDGTKKRPILLMRSIDDVSELIPFHRIVSSLHQRQSQSIEVDHEFLDDLIRSDFIESDYFPNPLLQDIREPSPF